MEATEEKVSQLWDVLKGYYASGVDEANKAEASAKIQGEEVKRQAKEDWENSKAYGREAKEKVKEEL